MAYIFQAWMKFCDLGILLKKKTMQIAQAEMLAAAVITVAYFTLIPSFGMLGAAWATLIGFATRFYWANKKGKENYDMELPWGKVWLIGLCAGFILALSYLVPDDLLLSITIRTGLMVLFVALFSFMPILSRGEKREVWRKLVEIKNKLMRINA
jgi:O-antigen/teichoic acid export membrane protein